MTGPDLTTVQPRHWSAPASDVLLADGTIAVIRSLRARRPGAGAGAARGRLGGHAPAALLLAEPGGRTRLRGAPVRRRPTSNRSRWWRWFADGSRRWRRRSCCPPRAPRSPSWCPTRIAAAAWAACSWSTLPRSAASTASAASRPRCSPTTTGCWACSGQRASRESRRAEDGEVSVELRTDASPAAIDAADRREWRSEARSLRPLLLPRERRGGRRTPRRRRPRSRRPRGDPRGRLRRPPPRRPPGGRLDRRPAGPPEPGRDRRPGRPGGGRGAGRPGHGGDGRRCRGRRAALPS